MIVAVEFFPIVIAPQDFGAALLGRGQDAVGEIVVADQNPHPRLAAVAAEGARLDPIGIGMGTGVLGIEDADMEVANLALAAVLVEEVPARHHAMEDTVRARIVAPAEYFGIESPGRRRIVRGKIDENERIRIGHRGDTRTWVFPERER